MSHDWRDRDAGRGADLRGSNFRHANLGYASLEDVDFHDADLSHAGLYGANLAGANLRHASLAVASLPFAVLRHAGIGHAQLPGAQLKGADLTGANLEDAELSGANFTDASMVGTPDAAIAGGPKRGVVLVKKQRARRYVLNVVPGKPQVWDSTSDLLVSLARGFAQRHRVDCWISEDGSYARIGGHRPRTVSGSAMSADESAAGSRSHHACAGVSSVSTRKGDPQRRARPVYQLRAT